MGDRRTEGQDRNGAEKTEGQIDGLRDRNIGRQGKGKMGTKIGEKGLTEGQRK